MNEEFLINLVETMLNEGIDEDRIINILSNLVEDEQVLPVSESCYNDIVNLTEAIIVAVINEGIMDDIKAGMDPEKAKKKWVKQKNKEFIEASKKKTEAERVLRKALDSSSPQYKKALDNLEKARRIEGSKFHTQNELNYNPNNSATYQKMILPVFKRINGSTKQVGFEKGNKTYKPKKD